MSETIEVHAFENHYECDCGTTWDDTWCAACNDHCPSCDTEIEPLSSAVVETHLIEQGSESCPVCGSPHEF